MQCLELQLQMDGIPIKKCQETNKKVMALSMNILVDQNLSVGTNLWVGDVHLVIKKKKKAWIANSKVVAAEIMKGWIKPILMAIKRRKSRTAHEQLWPQDRNGELIEMLMY